MQGSEPHSLHAEPRTLQRVRTAVMIQAISISDVLIDRRVLLLKDLAVPRGEVHAFDSHGMLIAKYKMPEPLP
jgi:hypothetical protein